MPEHGALFPALLKYWRGRRGLSQLDFALRAGVSPKHISFIETGRSAPSEEMVMLLAGTLALTHRQRDELLEAAGYVVDRTFDNPLSDPAVGAMIQQMLHQQEPFPMLVLDGAYNVLDMNRAARHLITLALGEVPAALNAVRTLFDPGGFRPFVHDWPTIARTVIDRLQRSALLDPTDVRLSRLINEVYTFADVDAAWRAPDFARPTASVMSFALGVGDVQLRFVTTVTRLHTPLSAALDDLQVEAWFPLDESTRTLCTVMAQEMG